MIRGLAEVSLQKSCECFAVTSLVSCHLVYGVVDCVEVCCFCTFSQVEFAGCSAVLSLYTHLEVFLCAVCNNLAEQFSEFCSVLSLFVSCSLPVQADLRIAFSVSDSCHCQIHTNL